MARAHIPALLHRGPKPALDIVPAPTGTEARVCADIARRQQLSIAKYGTTLEDNPAELREWLQHAYEESLDRALYLKRAIEQMDRQAAARTP